MAKTKLETQREWFRKRRHPCKDCGKLVSIYAKCCRECFAKSRRTDFPLCIDCKKIISHQSIRCVACNNKRITERKMANGEYPRGCTHQSWKGGRIQADGYMKIMIKEHPRANAKGYVLEHIVIWEEAHGKPLPKSWVIHHLNGIRNDNRLVNLMALPNKKHYLVLQAKAKRIQELEALLNNQSQLL